MSKILVLKDGTSFTFNDESSISCMTMTGTTFASVDPLRASVTTSNLVGATFNGTDVADAIPVSFSANSGVDGDVTITVTTRTKSETEKMAEQITELQEALAGIAR